MAEVNCGKLIEMLSQFPKDKPVKILALGVDYCDSEDINEVGYPLTNYDDEVDEKGNPVFVEEEDFVGIFTEDYVEHILMNGV